MVNLKKLKTLEIRWENICKFPDNIKELPLETIKISLNRGKIPEVVYSMTNLKRIEAHGAGIKTISEKIANFSKLEYLDLGDNYDLQTLPENIGELKNLKILRLSVCALKKLPESFCELRELQVLQLEHNKLKKLPENIGKLMKLRNLDLEANDLTSLPEEIVNLTNLSFINLSRNSNLKLTTQQMEWLNTLKDKGMIVTVYLCL